MLGGFLAYLIPIVGIILAIIWWRNRRINAKMCLISALIGPIQALLATLLAEPVYPNGYIQMLLSICLLIVMLAGVIIVIIYGHHLNQNLNQLN